MKAAPFFPTQKMSTTFAMSADDTSLHFDITKLTPKQIEDYESHKDLAGFLQVVLIGLGKPADYVAMYEKFGEQPWPERIERYSGFFRKMGLEPIPAEHHLLHPRDGFYASVAKALPPTDSITLYMTSGDNSVLHNDPEAFRISQNVNSKVHFAQNAPGFGLPVPDTLITSKGELKSQEVADFLKKHSNQVMLKVLGLSGARNVTPIETLQAGIEYVAEYEDDMEVILQQKLDLSTYTEMTADLTVSTTDITISNIRQIMFAEGIWVGNLIGPDVPVTEEHRQWLLKVGEYAKAQGFVSDEGYNCGVDYFISDDDFQITEINARWTGGLFPAEMIRRVGAGNETCVAFVDLVTKDKFDGYLDFVEHHLYSNKNRDSDEAFSVIPLGASAIPQTMEDGDYYFAWQVIAGDFEAFKKARREQLGDGALMRAETISVLL
jgi:hypothetical protein